MLLRVSTCIVENSDVQFGCGLVHRNLEQGALDSRIKVNNFTSSSAYNAGVLDLLLRLRLKIRRSGSGAASFTLTKPQRVRKNNITSPGESAGIKRRRFRRSAAGRSVVELVLLLEEALSWPVTQSSSSDSKSRAMAAGSRAAGGAVDTTISP